jgi:hypothetical protein
MMQSHPIHDNYVLISSDNHLRLFDLLSGTTLRVFATRHIETGVRLCLSIIRRGSRGDLVPMVILYIVETAICEHIRRCQ